MLSMQPAKASIDSTFEYSCMVMCCGEGGISASLISRHLVLRELRGEQGTGGSPVSANNSSDLLDGYFAGWTFCPSLVLVNLGTLGSLKR